MRIDALAGLLRATRADFDATSIADALWLAQAMGAFADDAAPAPTQAADADAPGATAPAPASAPGTGESPTAAPTAPPQRQPGDDALGLRAPLRRGDAGGGVPLAILAPRALRDPAALLGALGPLMVRDPRPAFDIDIEATVDALARGGALMSPPPGLPGERRWLRAVLIHESGPQTPMWAPTLRELAQVLRRRGAFRSLWRHELGLDGEGRASLRDVVTRREQGAAQALWHRDELIVIASDFVSDPWWRGVYPACVAAWREQNHVLLLHLLPPRLWPRSWTGAADQRLSGQVPGGASTTLLASAVPRAPGATAGRAARRPSLRPLATAIVPVEPGPIAQWAAVVVAAPGVVDGLHLGRRLRPLATVPPASAGTADPAERVEAFRARAAPLALQLARYLAVTAPLTLAMMQWVQAALLPASDSGHLAEFFLGGLLEVAQADADGDTVYTLQPEVRRHLAQGMPMSEAIAVIRAVGERLARAHGFDGDVLAMVSAGQIGRLPQASSELGLFAEVSRDFLVRAGRLPPLDPATVAPATAGVEAGVDPLLQACQRLTLLGEIGAPRCGVVVRPRLLVSASAGWESVPFVSGDQGRTLERVPGQMAGPITLWQPVDGKPFGAVATLDARPFGDAPLRGQVVAPVDPGWAWFDATPSDDHMATPELRMVALQGITDEKLLLGAPLVSEGRWVGLIAGAERDSDGTLRCYVASGSVLAQTIALVEQLVTATDAALNAPGSWPVDCAALSPGGRFLMAVQRAASGPVLRVWHADGLSPVTSQPLPEETTWPHAAISADGQSLYVAGSDGEVRLWRMDGADVATMVFATVGGDVNHLAAHPHAADTVLVCDAKGVHLFVNGRPDPQWIGDEGDEYGMVAEFSPDGQTIATLSSRELVLWSRVGRRRRWSQPNDRRPVALAFDASGRRVLACSTGEGARVQVVQVDSGAVLGRWFAPDPWVSCAAFLPDESQCLLANGHGLSVVDIASGALAHFAAYAGISWLALFDQGRQIAFHAAGSPLWSMPLGQLLAAVPPEAPMALPGNPSAHVKAAAGAAESASSDVHRLSARPGDDVVVMQIPEGPQLVLHPEGAQQLMPSPTSDKAGLGRLLFGAVQVITGLSGEATESLLTSEIVQRIDGQVEPGVYRLQAEALTPLKGSGLRLDAMPAAAGPQLVLLHGELVDSVAAFGSLWSEHPHHVRRLFDAYRGEVHGFEHATLGLGPIANALQLARACAPGARLHLLAHSRGGLVAEVLARACSARPIEQDDAFAGRLHDHAAWLDLHKLVHERSLRVERIVRVGCPAAGMALLSERLDVFLSLASWLLKAAGVPIAGPLVELAAQVARRRDAADTLPGLAALQPDSAFMAWLNAGQAPIDGQLRIVAGAVAGGGLVSRLGQLLADQIFFRGDNDLVVQTESMFRGQRRAAGASLFFLDRGSEVSHFQYFKNERSASAVVAALLDDEPAMFASVESRGGTASHAR